MKNIFKFLGMICIGLTLSNCEVDPIPSPDIKLTPVFSITDAVNDDEKGTKIVKMNIYKEKTQMSIWDNDVVLHIYPTENFKNSSNADAYNLEITAVDAGGDAGEITKYEFVIYGEKQSGEGSMDLTTIFPDGSEKSETFTVVIGESQIYI